MGEKGKRGGTAYALFEQGGRYPLVWLPYLWRSGEDSTKVVVDDESRAGGATVLEGCGREARDVAFGDAAEQSTAFVRCAVLTDGERAEVRGGREGTDEAAAGEDVLRTRADLEQVGERAVRATSVEAGGRVTGRGLKDGVHAAHGQDRTRVHDCGDVACGDVRVGHADRDVRGVLDDVVDQVRGNALELSSRHVRREGEQRAVLVAIDVLGLTRRVGDLIALRSVRPKVEHLKRAIGDVGTGKADVCAHGGDS